MIALANCHRCAHRSKVVITPCDAGAAYGYVAYCDNCSGGEFEVSHGQTKDAAALEWNEASFERGGHGLCTYCQATAVDRCTENQSRGDGVGIEVSVCEECCADLKRQAARAEAAEIAECRGDYERDLAKDGGR